MAERVLHGPPGLGPEIPEVKTEMISPKPGLSAMLRRAVPLSCLCTPESCEEWVWMSP